MLNPPWLEEIRAKLTSQGLPQPYIERLVRELHDHYNDIMEEKMNMESDKNSAADERMGQPAHIAEVAAGEYRMNSPLYWHKQKIPFRWLLSLNMIAIVMCTLASLFAKEPSWMLYSVLFALIVSFQHLTIFDEGVGLKIKFGPLSLYRTKILYSDIQKVEIGEYPFIGAPRHGGRMLGLWGSKYVAIQLQKSQIKIGTDDPANLADFLQNKSNQCRSGTQAPA